MSADDVPEDRPRSASPAHRREAAGAAFGGVGLIALLVRWLDLDGAPFQVVRAVAVVLIVYALWNYGTWLVEHARRLRHPGRRRKLLQEVKLWTWVVVGVAAVAGFAWLLGVSG